MWKIFEVDILMRDKMMKRLLIVYVLVGQFMCLQSAVAQGDRYKIYLDADFSNHLESSVSIERGLIVALDASGFKLMGREVELVRKDHRGNSARSERHIQQYLNDPDALLMVSGIHSPPLLAHREKINQEGVLFLVPWAAAGPITRYPSSVNWIFRLSVDDSKAGQVIARYAVEERQYKNPFLILENTGWGKSNAKTMSRALQDLGISNFKIGWFDWSLKEAGARSLANQAREAGADVVFLVANALEGKKIVNALATLPTESRPPVLSHWGIIGGDFHKQVTHSVREDIGLSFIQTRFSFIGKDLDDFESMVLESAKSLFPEIKTPADILAPTGFIHAHDLGRLMIEASKQVESNLPITITRKRLRAALEDIKKPVRGLIKTYRKPFSPYSDSQPDAHEALGISDFVMASFGAKDEIVLDSWRFK